MVSDGTRLAEIAETTSFLRYFSGLPDHRQAGKSGLSAPGGAAPDSSGGSCGCGGVYRYSAVWRAKIELLRRFRPYVNGTPSHDHLGDIFATLDARAFQLCFVAWVAALTNTPAEVIAVDGKTSRRSYQTKGSKDAIHMVSASRRGNALCWPGEGEREVERDRRHPGAARHDVDRGRGCDDRRDGLPARHRIENHREKGRLHCRAEGQSRALCARMSRYSSMTESLEIQGYHDQHARNRRR